MYGDENKVKNAFEFMRVQEELEGQPGKYTKGQFWGPGSNLGWFCSPPDPEVSPGEFQSRSNVRIGSGSNYETTNWVDRATANTATTAQSEATVPVTFSHDMKYTGQLPNSAVTVNKRWDYNVTVNGATVQMSPSSAPPPLSGTFTPTNNDAVTVVPSHTYSVKLPQVLSGTQTVTICERITFQDKTLQGTSWTGGESFSRACANITISASPPPPVVSSCPLPNSNYTMDFGGTQAQSGVVNFTKDGSWKTTDGTTSNPAFVWAKPGDSVQFKHTLCFGAQAVRGNNTDNGRTTSPRTEMPSTANTATIKAFTAPTSSGNYLFGKTLTGSSSQTFSLTRGQAQPAQVSGADQRGDYWFTYHSPSIKAGNNASDTYKCYAADRGFPNFVTNGYQIPGFTQTTIPSNCNSATRVPTASDVGKVIEQDLEWNNVRSWLTTQSSGSVSGCGCGDSSPSLPSITSVTYGSTSFRTDVGSHKGGCDRSGGCGWCNRTPNYTEYDYWYYPFTTTSATGAAQKAQVKIPFNYTSTPRVTTSQNILFPGGEYGVDVTNTINKRPNTDISTNEYATISKNSVYEIVAFTVAPDTAHTSIAHANDRVSGTGSKTACSYYNTGAQSCQSLKRETGVRFNDEGNLNGGVENLFNGDLAVPDAQPGTKFCVAVGVWPSDSHNFTSGPAGTGDAAMDINNGTYWNYAEPSCRTITKKPSSQFLNGGVYTNGGITTSQTKKYVNYASNGNLTVNGNNLLSNNANSGIRNVFGSFSQYEAIARGNIKGLASGATFGFKQNNNGNIYYSTNNTSGLTTPSSALPGGYPNVRYTEEAKECVYSSQTFSNDNCRNKVMGASNINSFGNTIVSRLASRYTSTDSGVPNQSGTLNLNSAYRLPAGPRYIRVNGNATIGSTYCMGKDATNNNTLVIDVSGTLTISANIGYGTQSGSFCNPQDYTNLAELPQIIIFAGDINITGSVRYIDAWLIAGQRGRGGGNINTCSDVANWNSLDSTKCATRLTVNGPVFAQKLTLNRTAGAGSNPHNASAWSPNSFSVAAAEIFNLRPDTYMWAYNQSQRFSQAVTTYSRELAPRF
jgi:hypothetical protein